MDMSQGDGADDLQGSWNSGELWERVSDRDAQAAVDGGDGGGTVDLDPREQAAVQAMTLRTLSDLEARPATSRAGAGPGAGAGPAATRAVKEAGAPVRNAPEPRGRGLQKWADITSAHESTGFSADQRCWPPRLLPPPRSCCCCPPP